MRGPSPPAGSVAGLRSRRRGHVVLVDDAREFHDSARSGYPAAEVVAAAARQHDYAMAENYDVFF